MKKSYAQLLLDRAPVPINPWRSSLYPDLVRGLRAMGYTIDEAWQLGVMELNR